jgi:hypothetical protein
VQAVGCGNLVQYERSLGHAVETASSQREPLDGDDADEPAARGRVEHMIGSMSAISGTRRTLRLMVEMVPPVSVETARDVDRLEDMAGTNGRRVVRG